MQPRQISVPKSFFVSERDKFYSEWIKAFPREFVQNSVDAGARNIDIVIEDAAAKGSFGREPETSRVTRVTFTDDGTGMSRKVLEDVFFALGESTKRDSEGSVGGFGRARIMQAFSQVRYSIRTQGNVVEGDGRDFDVVSPEEASATLAGWAAGLERTMREVGRTDPDRAARLSDAASALVRDVHRLAADGPVLKGCRFEVDLDPEAGDTYRRRPTVERVTKAFEEYFAHSDVKCRVTINGEVLAKPHRRTEARKKLAATMHERDIPASARTGKVEILDRADGRKDVVFATIHAIAARDMRDDEKGRLNVRVRGASMFHESSNSDDHALVLELVPALAREVLTSNRDGMRSPYREAVEAFTRAMATDANQALDGRESEEFTLLRGGMGQRIRARAAAAFEGVETPPPPRGADHAVLDLAERAGRRDNYVSYGSWNWDRTKEHGIEGVPFEDLKTFLTMFAKDGTATFLDRHVDATTVESLRQTMQRQGMHAALMEASGGPLGHIVANLKYRAALDDAKKASAYRDKMGDLNDVPILRKDMVPPAERYEAAEAKSRRSALMQASRRYDPRNWDTETGKGKTPHQVLTAWTVMVDHAVDLLLKAVPTQAPFPYATGWTFSHKKWGYVAVTRDEGWSNVGAKCLRPEREGPTRYFLLNPLEDEAFKNAYDHRDGASMAKLWALAQHEVAHVMSEDHDTRYAYALTGMMTEASPDFLKAMHREVAEKVKAVSAIYGKGRVRSAPMDDEPGPRPAERLLAGIAPEETMIPTADGGFTADGAGARSLFERGMREMSPEEEQAYSPAP